MNIVGNAVTSLRNLAALPKKALRQAALRLTSIDAMNPKGAPIREVRGSDDGHEFPMVVPGRDHTVLYFIPSNGHLHLPPKPLRGHDQWDGDYVRLPCSDMNKYPVEHPQHGKDKIVSRWRMIQDALRRPILDSKKLAEAILSYNHTYRNVWKFKALHALFDDLTEDERSNFFHITLPAMAKLALQLPELIQSPIPLLKQGMNHSISLSQQQISCLLANAFFCTFPRRNSTNKSRKEYASYPHINFVTLYEPYDKTFNVPYDDVSEKLKCLMSYFVRVTKDMPLGVVTFTRRSVPVTSCPWWEHSDTYLSNVPLHVDSEGMIEKARGLIQLDFANKYIGGGVLGHGSVQEEIRFVTCPELMVSMLFTEVLKDNEALVMIGAEQFNQYIGYGSSFQWNGQYGDGTARDSSARRNTAVLAIDALPFKSSEVQFKKRNIDRELNKAWVGFSAYGESQGTSYPGVATGNWGCGAFRGSPPLKSLIQLMACAEARRPMAYFTFNDDKFRDELHDIYLELCRNNVTVGELYSYILRFADSKVKKSDLFPYLRQVMVDKGRRPRASASETAHHSPRRDRSSDSDGNSDYERDGYSRDSDRSDDNFHGHSTDDGGRCNNCHAAWTTSRDAAAGHQETLRPKDTQPQQEDSFQASRGLRSGSPDLFSQDEDQSQNSNPKNTNQQEIGQDDVKMTNSNTDHKITDSDARLFETSFDNYDSDIKMSDSDAKLPDDNATKMSVEYSSLPDGSNHISDGKAKLTDRTKMSESDIRRYVNVNTTWTKSKHCQMSESEVKITIESSGDDTKTNTASHSKDKDNYLHTFTQDTENARTKRQSDHTKSLFDEMEKFDDANGKLNISVTKTASAVKRRNAVLIDSDVSMETDEKVEPPEPKKKIIKKITDYFKSNPM